MPAIKPTKNSLEARRKTRKALMEALRSIREARKSVGSFGPRTVDPVKYPPQPPDAICRVSTSPTKVFPVYPPRTPTFICRILGFPPRVPNIICGIPPVPKGVTKKDLAVGLYVLEFWTRFLVKVVDRLYPKQPPRPKPKSLR